MSREQLVDDGHLSILDGVSEGREGRLGWGETRCGILQGRGGMRKGRVGNLGHFAAQRAGEVEGDVLVCEIGQGEQVGELGEGGLGGEIEAKDDAGATELRAWGVDGGDEAAYALGDVDDDDAALDGCANDVREAAVGAAGDVAHAKGFEDQAPQVGEAEHGVDHLGLDAGEDAKAGDVGRVQVLLDNLELGDGRRAQHERPVDGDAEAVDLGQRVEVGRGKGLEGGGADLCGPVAPVQLVVEEEADFWYDEGAGDDERPEEVVDGVGLQREDGRLGARQDDGLAEVGHDEGEGGGGVGEGVGAVEDDEAIEEVVVFLDARGHGGPVGGGNGGGVEEGGEFEDGVADVAVVGGWWRAEGVEGEEVALAVGLELDIWAGHVVKGRPRRHGTIEEALAGGQAIGAFLHAYRAAGADDEDARLRQTGGLIRERRGRRHGWVCRGIERAKEGGEGENGFQ